VCFFLAGISFKSAHIPPESANIVGKRAHLSDFIRTFAASFRREARVILKIHKSLKRRANHLANLEEKHSHLEDSQVFEETQESSRQFGDWRFTNRPAEVTAF
jgi:hypothetical protein